MMEMISMKMREKLKNCKRMLNVTKLSPTISSTSWLKHKEQARHWKSIRAANVTWEVSWHSPVTASNNMWRKQVSFGPSRKKASEFPRTASIVSWATTTHQTTTTKFCLAISSWWSLMERIRRCKFWAFVFETAANFMATASAWSKKKKRRRIRITSSQVKSWPSAASSILTTTLSSLWIRPPVLSIYSFSSDDCS